MIGLVNVVRCCGEHATRSRGGFLGGLLGALTVVFALVAGLSWLYRAAESALLGVEASTAEANRTVAWALAVVLVLLVGGGVTWALLGRRRDVRDEPLVTAHRVATDRALEARRQARALPTASRQALDSVDSVHQLYGGPRGEKRVHVLAQRLDRLPRGGGQR